MDALPAAVEAYVGRLETDEVLRDLLRAVGRADAQEVDAALAVLEKLVDLVAYFLRRVFDHAAHAKQFAIDPVTRGYEDAFVESLARTRGPEGEGTFF